jgi:hypothetical protein
MAIAFFSLSRHSASWQRGQTKGKLPVGALKMEIIVKSEKKGVCGLLKDIFLAAGNLNTTNSVQEARCAHPYQFKSF